MNLKHAHHRLQHLIKLSVLLCLALGVTPIAAATPLHLQPQLEQGQQLGWENQPPDQHSWCPGHFPIADGPIDGDSNSKQAITITAEESATIQPDGHSVIAGGVHLKQGNRELTADKVTLYNKPDGDGYERLTLEGNVTMREQDKMILADRLDINTIDQTGTAVDILYRIQRNPLSKQVAWGSAKKLKIIKRHYLRIYAATYSTCPPTETGWRLHSQRISLNKASGRGQAQHAWLSIGKIPVFYFPYLDFPLDKRRKSGFLAPHYSSSSVNGHMISLPYYWNIAPNRDATITPQHIEKRGTEAAVQLRNMDRRGNSAIKLHWMPDDKLFNDFKATARTDYPSANEHFLSDIDGAKKQRYFVHLDDDRQWNPSLHTSVNINYVSDDYQFQDLNFSDFSEDTNQLTNQLHAIYHSDFWRTSMLVSSYQTLHRINNQKVEDQYRQLPAFTINGELPFNIATLGLSGNAGLAQFDKSRNYLTNVEPTTGWRYYIQPTISKNIRQKAADLNASLTLSSTAYQLQHQAAGTDAKQQRHLPIFSLNAKSLLGRNTTLFGTPYLHTLEPQLHYLYVPFQDQNSLPDFDTDLPAFGTAMLTSNNRFTGMDRIGDANQVGISLNSRLLTQPDNAQKLTATIGGIVYFANRKVCLTSACDNDNEQHRSDTMSPLAASLNYALGQHWDIVLDAAYEPNRPHLQNSHGKFAYHRDDKHLFSLGYEFLRGGDEHPDSSLSSDDDKHNLYRIKASTYWPINHRWQGMGHLHYNLSHRYLEDYFVGTEYQSCCWALRVIWNRKLLNEDAAGHTSYDSQLQLQIALKGLTSFQHKKPHNQLVKDIDNFNDHLGDYQ